MTLFPLTANQTILKVLVGSHTHGPAGLERDKDFRSAFVMPTADKSQLVVQIRWRRDIDHSKSSG